ncbi:MAG: hypothetical protein HXY50_01070 [Ignavibacteriaceae bacterium]|nr:hypothetical protein [Ignavibacteriaceae bacterium]
MDKLNKFSKSLLFLFVISGTIWLGSYITRLSVFYNLFQPEGFILKEFVTNLNISGIFSTLIAAISINLIFYILMVLSFILFVITAKLKIRENGWLFISIVLIISCLPFEIYLMIIDYQIINDVWSGNFDSNKVLSLVIKRFTVLSSFSIVEILSFFTVIFLFMFQPLKGIKRKLVE